MTLIKSLVTCAGLEGGPYECWLDPDDNWNGYDKPWFTREVGFQILANNPSAVSWSSYRGEFYEGNAYFDKVSHAECDTPLHAIGAGSWRWEEYDPADPRLVTLTKAERAFILHVARDYCERILLSPEDDVSFKSIISKLA